jgi:tripartite-type tricarboxylate transporter receptor subunit TctC
MGQRFRRDILGMAAGFLSLMGKAKHGHAGNYPDHLVTYIVPFAPNGFNHLVAQLIVRELDRRWPEGVRLRSISGDSGTRGIATAAKSDPDGYTLLQISSTSFSYTTLLQEFSTISVIASTPLVFCVNSASYIRTYEQLLRRLKDSNAPPVVAGSPGEGSPSYLLLQQVVDLYSIQKGRIKHVQYGGGAPAIANLLANNIDLVVSNLPECITFLQQGWLRGIAISRPHSYLLAGIGEIPGTDDLKARVLGMTNWTAVMARTSKDAPVLRLIGGAIQSAIGSDLFYERLDDFGITALCYGQTASCEYIDKELVRWKNRNSKLPSIENLHQ